MESAVHMLLSRLISIYRILRDGLRYGVCAFCYSYVASCAVASEDRVLTLQLWTLKCGHKSDVWACMMIMRPMSSVPSASNLRSRYGPYVDHDDLMWIRMLKLSPYALVMWNPSMALKFVHMPPSSGATLVDLGDK